MTPTLYKGSGKQVGPGLEEVAHLLFQDSQSCLLRFLKPWNHGQKSKIPAHTLKSSEPRVSRMCGF